MADTEPMDVEHAQLHNYSVWFFPGFTTIPGRLQLNQVDHKGLSVEKLKQLILVEDAKRSVGLETAVRTADQFNLLCNGNLLKANEPLKLKPEAIVYVVKNVVQEANAAPKAQSPGAASTSVIRTLSLGLRDSFVASNFIRVIDKLKEVEMLQNLFTAAPGLETDVVGIAMIQTPQLMFQLSDPEILERVVAARPWLVDALKHVIALVKADRASRPSGSRGSASEALNTAFLDGNIGDDDDDDMDDDDLDPQRTRSQPNFHGPITREQLTQALNALPVGGGIPSVNSFLDYLGSPAPAQTRPTTAPPLINSWNPGFQQILQNAFGSAAASNPSGGPSAAQNLNLSAPRAPPAGSNPQASLASPAITPEFLAQAMQAAISQLPAEQQAEQFERFRQLAQQVASGNPTPTPPPTPSVASTPVAPVPREFDRELGQMRELGITDERLATLALRVSEGDVETAVELVFSGWDGSGAE